jgi:uncharacterized protein YeaO (DUF488 family)
VADIRIKRIYDGRSPQDGSRILVDRVWPRGLTKAAADLDEWCRDIAPSTALRQWYGHDVALFEQFRERYLSELEAAPGATAAAHLRELARTSPMTLLTASKDLEISQAAVLAPWLQA